MQLNRLKYTTVATVLSWGYDVLSTDVDVHFLRNPLPWLTVHAKLVKRACFSPPHKHYMFSDVDILLHTDWIETKTFDGGLELRNGEGIQFYCIGIMYAKATAATISFIHKVWLGLPRHLLPVIINCLVYYA